MANGKEVTPQQTTTNKQFKINKSKDAVVVSCEDDPGTLITENLVNLFPHTSHSYLVLRIYSNSSVDVYSIIFEHKAYYPLRMDHSLICCHFF